MAFKQHLLRTALKTAVGAGKLVQDKQSFKLSAAEKKPPAKPKKVVKKKAPKKKVRAPRCSRDGGGRNGIPGRFYRVGLCAFAAASPPRPPPAAASPLSTISLLYLRHPAAFAGPKEEGRAQEEEGRQEGAQEEGRLLPGTQPPPPPLFDPPHPPPADAWRRPKYECALRTTKPSSLTRAHVSTAHRPRFRPPRRTALATPHHPSS